MQGSIDLDVQSFFEKFFLYGGLIWLLAQAGMALRLASSAVAALLLATSGIEMYIPGRSAEITDAIFALIIGAFIQGVEAGTHQTMRMPGLAIVTISDIKRRFAIARGVPLSHRIIYLPADDAAK